MVCDHELVPEANVIVATGIDLKSPFNGPFSFRHDFRIDDRRIALETQRNHFPFAFVNKVFRLPQRHPFARHIDLHYKTPEKAGSQNPVARPPTPIRLRWQGRNASRLITLSVEIEHRAFVSLRLLLAGDANDSHVPDTLEFQRLRAPGVDNRNAKT